MTTYNTIEVTENDRVTSITLNRPERRNALTAVMIAELTSALAEFSASTHSLILILTGAGEAFCSGLDLEELKKLSTQSAFEQRADSDRIAHLMRTLYDCPKPTIAAVTGAAVAGGMGLATICDFTLAAPGAKFGYPEVRIGFIPAIVAAFLRIQVGDKIVRDLLLTGRLLEAEEAARLGLVTRVVESSALASAAQDLAASLLKNSPSSLAATKQLLRRQNELQLTHDLASAAEANADIRRTPDFAEGLSAFLEKRKPVWSGKNA